MNGAPVSKCHRRAAIGVGDRLITAPVLWRLGVVPGLDVADRAREEAGAAFGRGVIRGEAIHESLHLWMANRLLEDAKRHERDSLHRDRLCERCKSDQQRLHRIPESGVQRHFRW